MTRPNKELLENVEFAAEWVIKAIEANHPGKGPPPPAQAVNVQRLVDLIELLKDDEEFSRHFSGLETKLLTSSPP